MLGCVDGTVVAMVTSSVVVSVEMYCKQCVEPKNAGFPYNRPGRLILIWDDKMCSFFLLA